MSTQRIFSHVPSRSLTKDPEADFSSLSLNASSLQALFLDCADFTLRPVWPGGVHTEGIFLCWLDGLVSARSVAEEVLHPLASASLAQELRSPSGLALALQRGGIWAGSVQRRDTAADTVQDLLQGCCALVFDRSGLALTFEVKSDDTRSISDPKVEKTLKGAKDAFVETLRTNTSLVRRRLRTPTLKLRQITVGRRSSTSIAILYIEGLTAPELVAALCSRLEQIDVDGITASGNIEQYIVDRPLSAFPQLLHTERPDMFSAELLAGRAGFFVDGLPMGFLTPATLSSFLHVAEDRAQPPPAAALLTLLRWFSLIISLVLPAFFTAIVMYHQEMIPTALLQNMIEAKQQVPFSEAFEILMMLVAFELLMEAGIRLPNPVGDTVSIIGGLIVGQSAVEAKVVSPISVIIVAASAICGFTLPSRDLGSAIRLLRAAFTLLSIFFGLLGLSLGLALLLWYLCTIDSFGVPYTSPMSEGGFFEILRALVRLPLPRDKLRDRALHPRDRRNQV